MVLSGYLTEFGGRPLSMSGSPAGYLAMCYVPTEELHAQRKQDHGQTGPSGKPPDGAHQHTAKGWI